MNKLRTLTILMILAVILPMFTPFSLALQHSGGVAIAQAQEGAQGSVTDPAQEGREDIAEGDIDLGGCGLKGLSGCMPLFVSTIALISLQGTSLLVGISGDLMEFVFDITVVRMAEQVDKIGGLDIAWETLRDLANMLFIFILLYISISTILNLSNVNTAKMLTYVVVIALLINFSMFFTKVIIDASNFVATGFYNAIVTEESGSISTTFMDQLGISSIYDSQASDEATSVDGLRQTAGDRVRNLAIIGLGGSALMIITGFTFLATALLFIIRFAMLVLLIILSPIAFAAMILPQTQGQARRWWGELTKQAIFAPAYFALLWVTLTVLGDVIQSPGDATFTKAFIGEGGEQIQNGSTLFFNFSIAIVFMLAVLMLSQNMGVRGGAWAHNTAKKGLAGTGRLVGRGAAAGAGAAGRNTVGSWGQSINQSETLKNAEARGSKLAKWTRQAGSYAGTSSFDARANKWGAKAAGGKAQKGGYKGRQEEIQKKAGDQATNLKKDVERTQMQEGIRLAKEAEEKGRSPEQVEKIRARAEKRAKYRTEQENKKRMESLRASEEEKSQRGKFNPRRYVHGNKYHKEAALGVARAAQGKHKSKSVEERFKELMKEASESEGGNKPSDDSKKESK